MTPRATEPSERVEEILDEDRPPRVLELPSTVARGRYGVSRQAIIGVTLVVVVAVVMLGGRYVLARGEATPEPVVAESDAESGATSGPDPVPGAEGTPAASTDGAGPGAAPGAAPTEVTVHVVGEVRRPGVITLPAGSRLGAALDEAGGETAKADLSGVNLARPLIDGEQVHVPKPGEDPVAAAPPTGAPAGSAPPAPGAPAGEVGAPVNLNTADLATLETLPGVGPVLAQRIIDWRTEHGRFTTIEELGEVSGVGEKTFAQLAPKVAV